MIDWLQIVGGGLLLYFGADWFVGGASRLARSLRVPQMIIGLTVVSYGTSLPEAIVGLQAAASGHGGLVIGNVIGSNIANIGLILGLAALIQPIAVDGSLRARELPVLVVSTALIPLALLDGVIHWWEGGLLLMGSMGYTLWMLRAARTSMGRSSVPSGEGEPAPGSPLLALVTLVVGLGGLLAGGSLFVTGAVSIARALGMSDRVVGLTIVALGTSLPELVTSVVAARRGHSDIAVGNVIGSNIFNALFCLAGATLAGPVRAPLANLWLDLLGLFTLTALLVAFTRRARTIRRWEGALALAIYLVLTATIATRG